jgi:folate-binding protein YgfZ
MRIHLQDRALLGLTGSDAYEFLQSTITNEMSLLESQQAIYAAHLTTKGKFLYDFFVSKIDDMYVIDCHKDELMPLAQALNKYVINKDVDFHNLSDDYQLIVADQKIENSTLSYPDPRHKELGFRSWVKELPENLESSMPYTQKRINLGIIDGAYDGLKERSLINEMGFEELNGVSFNKGCYVGQELTARTKFRTEPKKKVFKVKFNGDVQLGDIIKCGQMDAGWIFSNINHQGLAIIRTRYLDKKLTLNNEEVNIQT